jgi:drug/metabolite transporter (DMT)-like permease
MAYLRKERDCGRCLKLRPYWQRRSDKMTSNQIIGLVLLVVGALLLFFGYQASQAVGEQLHETFTGRFTDTTPWYFILGAAAAIGGIAMLALKR